MEDSLENGMLAMTMSKFPSKAWSIGFMMPEFPGIASGLATAARRFPIPYLVLAAEGRHLI